jgi:hypothetical protein
MDEPGGNTKLEPVPVLIRLAARLSCVVVGECCVRGASIDDGQYSTVCAVRYTSNRLSTDAS